MYIILESSIKGWNGIFDISILIINEENETKSPYTFHLNDVHTVNKIEWMVGKHRNLHGYALNLLKKNNIVEYKQMSLNF
jgi:hypothetical protein